MAGLTESVRMFEYVANNTKIVLITLDRKSGEFVSLEVYYDIMKNDMLTDSFNHSLELVLNVSKFDSYQPRYYCYMCYYGMTPDSLAAGDTMMPPADYASGGPIAGWPFCRIG